MVIDMRSRTFPGARSVSRTGAAAADRVFRSEDVVPLVRRHGNPSGPSGSESGPGGGRVWGAALGPADWEQADWDLCEPGDPGHTISCTDCVARHSDACADCIVTFLCDGVEQEFQPAGIGAGRAEQLELDADEADTLRLFQAAGLAPALRHVSRTSRVASQLAGRDR